MVGNTETSVSAGARTLAQQLRTLYAILSESPFDPATNPDVGQWATRLQETVTNLNTAFAEAVVDPEPRRNSKPTTENAEGENPNSEHPSGNRSPREARDPTPPRHESRDLHEHLDE